MKIRTEVKVGIIAVVSIAIFVWGYNFMKGVNIARPSQTYNVVYQDINGLKKSNTVTLNGYKVGLVSDIHLMPNQTKNLLVKILLSEDFKIPINSTAVIYSVDLMGSQGIKLELSNESIMHKPGDTLAGIVQASMLDLVGDELIPVKTKVENVLTSIDSVMSVVQYTFTPEFSKNINGTMQHLNRSAGALDTFLTADDGKFNNILTNLDSISASLKNNMDELNLIMGNVASITDSIASGDIKELLTNLNSSTRDLHVLLSGINEGKGTIGMLATNDTLYYNLEDLTKSLDLLLIDLKENPGKYVKFSMFGGGKKDKKKSKE
ncbi:MAG: MlaD family protein [Bacteroidales bacterium]|nr:MlaD family protein [Bacteroidales bacterium]